MDGELECNKYRPFTLMDKTHKEELAGWKKWVYSHVWQQYEYVQYNVVPSTVSLYKRNIQEAVPIGDPQ